MSAQRPGPSRPRLAPQPNPVLKGTFADPNFNWDQATGMTDVMTLEGTVMKTTGLLMLTVISGAATWLWSAGSPGSVALWMPIAAILGAAAMAFIATRNPTKAATLAPIFAILEGAAMGWISLAYHVQYDGIVVQAIGLTVAIAAALFFAYSTGLIDPSENFKLGVAAATGGIMLFYLVSIGLSLFGVQAPLIHSSGGFGIAFSLFVVALASANLVIDFDFVEDAVERRAPSHLEWVAAIGIVSTLVWLYLELLRLLAKLQDR